MPRLPIPPIRIEGNIAYVPLTRGYEAIIDAADVPLVSGIRWFVSIKKHTEYAWSWVRADSGRYQIIMHRELLSAAPGTEVDHKNHNGLDNRKENLRIATTSENRRNSLLQTRRNGRLKGAGWHKHSKKWRGYIALDGKQKSLGYFHSEQEAHDAYVLAAKSHWGEWMCDGASVG